MSAVEEYMLKGCTYVIVVLIIYLPCCCFEILSFCASLMQVLSHCKGVKDIHRRPIGDEYSH
jgi:hypothetical protein